MKMFVANLLLAIVWSLMMEGFTLATLVIGFISSYVLLWFLRPLIGGSGYFNKMHQIAAFTIFFVRELIVANLRIAWHVVTPSSFFKPGIIAVPLEEQTDLEATLLANVLTLTPGSFSVDLSSDRKVLYVHVMDVDDADRVRQEIKDQYERPFLELLR
ncbi:MAG TPA: Na+/H+ antiporter subunit E [Phycisphaerales bacterium]|nr:Na+/H+ antiporter subunit E [Phycisphaerales bacterium]HRQ76815.1 Na+/H+ antiporter subunit E [Phycisphaerales bacterium]